MNLKSFDLAPEKTSRSNTILIVKNIPFDAKPHKLRELFKNWGEITKFLVAPNNVIIIIQFATVEHA